MRHLSAFLLAITIIALNLYAAAGPVRGIAGKWVVTAVNNPDGRLTRRAIMPGKTVEVASNGTLFAEFEHFAGIIAADTWCAGYCFTLTDTATDERFGMRLTSNKQSLSFVSQYGDTFSVQRQNE